MNDTVRTGRQAAEDTMMSMVDAGLIPGMYSGHVGMLSSMPGVSVLFYRIAREVSRLGPGSGAVVAQDLLSIPRQHHGNVLLSFDGWADDPRPLSSIPEVVAFCAGLLLGEALTDADHARSVMNVLMNEVDLIAAGEDPSEAFDMSGRLWLVSHAYSRQTILVDRESPSGFSKDILAVMRLATSLQLGTIPMNEPGYATR